MKKIMFNDHYGLTRAVLNSRKTMTRRVEKELERIVTAYEKDYGEPFEIIFQKWDEVTSSLSIFTPHGMVKYKPHYYINEVVAVAQCYKDVIDDLSERYREWVLAYYRGTKAWTNKLYVLADLMPSQVRIKDVKIERLQDISIEDVYKEGFTENVIKDGWSSCFYHWEAVLVYYDKMGCTKTIQSIEPRHAYAMLIERPGVGHVGIWEENPFVVVYDFCLHQIGKFIFD